MPIKIENQYEGKLPRNALANVETALGSVPREHLRGVERLRLVNSVIDPRALMAATEASARLGCRLSTTVPALFFRP